MPFVFELIIALLIVLGAIFAFVGSLGLLKLPDLMTRLHAPTKATTLGLGGRWRHPCCTSCGARARCRFMKC